MYYWAEWLVHSPLPYTREKGQCVPSTRKVPCDKRGIALQRVTAHGSRSSGDVRSLQGQEWTSGETEWVLHLYLYIRVVSAWCLHKTVCFECVYIYSHMHACACICGSPARFKGLRELTNKYHRENLPERVPFASTQATAARDSRDTEQQQCGRRRKQPVSNLFLQSTVKIPAECSHLSQSCTM